MLSSLLQLVWITLLIGWEHTTSILAFCEPTLTHTHTQTFTHDGRHVLSVVHLCLCVKPVSVFVCVCVTPEDVWDLKKQVNLEVKLISIKWIIQFCVSIYTNTRTHKKQRSTYSCPMLDNISVCVWCFNLDENSDATEWGLYLHLIIHSITF